ICHRARLCVRLRSPTAPCGHRRLALPRWPSRLRLLRLKGGHPGQLVSAFLKGMSKKFRDEASPALVRCPHAAPGIAVEVLVQQRVITDLGVAIQSLPARRTAGVFSAQYRPAAAAVAKEDARQASRQLVGDFANRGEMPGACWAFDFEVIAIVVA